MECHLVSIPGTLLGKAEQELTNPKWALYLCMCVLEGLYMHHMCVGALRGQKRMLDALDLQLRRL